MSEQTRHIEDECESLRDKIEELEKNIANKTTKYDTLFNIILIY